MTKQPPLNKKKYPFIKAVNGYVEVKGPLLFKGRKEDFKGGKYREEGKIKFV